MAVLFSQSEIRLGCNAPGQRAIIHPSVQSAALVLQAQNTQCERVAGEGKNKSKKRLPKKQFRLLSDPLFSRHQPYFEAI
jgi:hypothetical protein